MKNMKDATKVFLNDIKTMRFDQLIKLPCTSGGFVQIEKATERHYNMLYFKRQSIQPNSIMTTDYASIEHVVRSMAA